MSKPKKKEMRMLKKKAQKKSIRKRLRKRTKKCRLWKHTTSAHASSSKYMIKG